MLSTVLCLFVCFFFVCLEMDMVVFLETCFFPYGRYKTFNIVMVSVDGKELADK